MTERYLVPASRERHHVVELPPETITKILVVGHGAIAEKQAPAYTHWQAQNIQLHFADVDEHQLADCLPNTQAFVLPHQEREMLKHGPFDVVLINNVPELHLVTALTYGTYAKQIIIQKPQDLNYPLIRTIANGRGFEHFLPRTVVHDHYRNKSVVPALLRWLPTLLERFGRFRRVMLFLTEARSVSDEWSRAASLSCGMIQDLATHVIDLMLECLLAADEWRHREGTTYTTRRLESIVSFERCVKLREQNCPLRDDVETFAALDLHVTELLEFPAGVPGATRTPHSFDVLIVVGKGLSIEQGVQDDLKSVVIEFERGTDSYAVVDLASLGMQLVEAHEVNRHHGGLNRPLMLMVPNPPEHAVRGLGGAGFPQWQTFAMAEHVSAIVETCRRWQLINDLGAYPYQRPLGDMIAKLASTGRIRSVWSGLPSLTNFQIASQRETPFYA